MAVIIAHAAIYDNADLHYIMHISRLYDNNIKYYTIKINWHTILMQSMTGFQKGNENLNIKLAKRLNYSLIIGGAIDWNIVIKKTRKCNVLSVGDVYI